MVPIALPFALVLCQQVKVYFGNLHAHTSYSDGSGTPAEAYAHARDAADLDFLAITEHNHSKAEFSLKQGDPRRDGILIATAPHLYHGRLPNGGTDQAALILQANRFTVDGQFVALYGQEFSSIGSGNHVNVFEVGEVIDEDVVANGDFKALATWLVANKDSAGKSALMQFNHPALHDDSSNEYGRDDLGTAKQWRTAMDAHAELIEILNGPSTGTGTGNPPEEFMEYDYLYYLNKGFHLAPTADQDNHFKTWGDCTEARTAVLAEQLTKSAILEGLRARHVYATEDRNLRLIPRVNGHLVGDRVTTLPVVGEELAITLEILDDDDPMASYKVEVLSDTKAEGSIAGVVETAFAAGPGNVSVSGVTFRGAGQYVFLRVTQTDEDGHRDLAWTAPVWFEADTVAPVVLVHIDSLLPNPVGDDDLLEQAVVHNAGNDVVSMVGWKLQDKDGKFWILDTLGTLQPNQAKTIVRNSQPMSLNNSGLEVISLVSPTEGVVDQIEYSGSSEGQLILHHGT